MIYLSYEYIRHRNILINKRFFKFERIASFIGFHLFLPLNYYI